MTHSWNGTEEVGYKVIHNLLILFKRTTSIKNIEDRLLGSFTFPKAKGLPLSIEGQVHSLIQVNIMYFE